MTHIVEKVKAFFSPPQAPVPDRYSDISSVEDLQEARFRYYFDVLLPSLRGHAEYLSPEYLFSFAPRKPHAQPLYIVGLHDPLWRTKRFGCEAIIHIASEPHEYESMVKGVRFVQIQHGENEAVATSFLAVREPGVGIGRALCDTSALHVQDMANRVGPIKYYIEDENQAFADSFLNRPTGPNQLFIQDALAEERRRWEALFSYQPHQFTPGAIHAHNALSHSPLLELDLMTHQNFISQFLQKLLQA